jgi:hypothetical protein
MKAVFESSSGCGNFGFGILDFGLGTRVSPFGRVLQSFVNTAASVALAHRLADNLKSQIEN